MRSEDISVIVVGAGALGNGVCQALGLLGIGSVTVIDGDHVATRNLDSCTLLRGAFSVGDLKVRALAAEAARLFPGTKWRTLGRWFSEAGFGDFAGASLVFSCVDNEVARLEIALACLRLGLPLVDGGIAEGDEVSGRVTWFPSPSAACFACLLPMARVSKLLQGIDLMGASCSDGQLGAGVTGTGGSVAGMVVGGWQAHLGIRCVTGSETGTRTWRLQLSGTYRLDSDSADRRPACPFHENEVKTRIQGPGKANVAVRAWMAAGQIPQLLLDWPLCIVARCSGCRNKCQPFRYLSIVRWRLPCPSCGKRSLIPESSVRALRPEQPWLGKSFELLGLSANHWYRW